MALLTDAAAGDTVATINRSQFLVPLDHAP